MSFNKKLPFGICIGLNELSILFIHHKMFYFPSLWNYYLFSQNFFWQIWLLEFYHIPMNCNAKDQSSPQENCWYIYLVISQLEILPEALPGITVLGRLVKDIVTDWESVTKPKHSVDLARTNIDLSRCTTNARLSTRVTISFLYLWYLAKLLRSVIKSSINPAAVTCCNLRKERGGYSNFVSFCRDE